MCQADGGSSDGPPVDTAPSGSNSTHGAGAPGASEAHAGASPAGGGLGGQRSRQYTHFVLCLLAASEGGLGCEHGAVLSAALTQDLAALSRLLPARCLILGLFQAPEAASLFVAGPGNPAELPTVIGWSRCAGASITRTARSLAG